MEPRTQPGRNDRSEFISNDATADQVNAALIEIVAMLAGKQWWHEDEQQKVDELLKTAKGANALADPGRRTALEDQST